MESAVKKVEYTLVALLGIAVGLISILGYGERAAGDSEQVQHMSQKTIEQVQEEHTAEWMAIPGVEGTAIGLFENKPCVKIFVSVQAEQIRAKIPSTVEDYPVIIEETGTFHALDQQ